MSDDKADIYNVARPLTPAELQPGYAHPYGDADAKVAEAQAAHPKTIKLEGEEVAKVLRHIGSLSYQVTTLSEENRTLHEENRTLQAKFSAIDGRPCDLLRRGEKETLLARVTKLERTLTEAHNFIYAIRPNEVLERLEGKDMAVLSRDQQVRILKSYFDQALKIIMGTGAEQEKDWTDHFAERMRG